MLASTAGLAQAPVWQIDEVAAHRGQSDNRNKAYFSNRFQALRSLLHQAPLESSGDNSYIISLPMPDGSRSRFSIIESPVMAKALADKAGGWTSRRGGFTPCFTPLVAASRSIPRQIFTA